MGWFVFLPQDSGQACPSPSHVPVAPSQFSARDRTSAWLFCTFLSGPCNCPAQGSEAGRGRRRKRRGRLHCPRTQGARPCLQLGAFKSHFCQEVFLSRVSGTTEGLEAGLVRLIRGRPNTRGKRCPAHQVIDKDPVESVGVEGFPAIAEIHGNERPLPTQDVSASPYVSSFSVTPLLDFF